MVSARNRRVLRARGAVDRVKGYTIVDADFSSPAILVAVEAMGLCFPDVSTLSFCFFCGPLRDQLSQNVLDRSSANFQDLVAYG